MAPREENVERLNRKESCATTSCATPLSRSLFFSLNHSFLFSTASVSCSVLEYLSIRLRWMETPWKILDGGHEAPRRLFLGSFSVLHWFISGHSIHRIRTEATGLGFIEHFTAVDNQRGVLVKNSSQKKKEFLLPSNYGNPVLERNSW